MKDKHCTTELQLHPVGEFQHALYPTADAPKQRKGSKARDNADTCLATLIWHFSNLFGHSLPKVLLPHEGRELLLLFIYHTYMENMEKHALYQVQGTKIGLGWGLGVGIR